jgi:replicative DNA helicase
MTNTDLPHTLDGERAILSCILLDGAASLSKALDAKIGEEAFFDPIHRKVWRAILWLHKNNQAIDITILADELNKKGKLEEIGGIEGLMQATKGVATTIQFDHWLERVRDAYINRKLIETCDRMAEKARANSGSVEDFVQATHDILSVRHATQTIQTLSQASDEAIVRAESILAGTEKPEERGLSWPWADWNTRFGPATAGELVIIGARPGIGKSSSARQCCLSWAESGEVLLFSREMPIGGLPYLFAQQISGISWKEFRDRKLHKSDEADFIEALKAIRAMKRLHIFDRDRTLSQVTARIRAFSQVKKVKAIAIDYLQRYDPQQDKGETRDVALGRMSMAFKDMAVDLGVPVLLLAQVSRGVEREAREPRISDLRESGNLEQDADRIIFLHAPAQTPSGMSNDPTDRSLTNLYTEAIQAKGRGEGQDRAPLNFHRPTTRFLSIQP